MEIGVPRSLNVESPNVGSVCAFPMRGDTKVVLELGHVYTILLFMSRKLVASWNRTTNRLQVLCGENVHYKKCTKAKENNFFSSREILQMSPSLLFQFSFATED